MADITRTVAALKETFPSDILDVVEHRGETTVTVTPDNIVPICSFLKTECGFTFLVDVTAVDYLGKRDPRFMVVYHLTNMAEKCRIRVKAPVGGDEPCIDTLSGLWNSANWLEREVWDLMGIHFNGHPDLRRILMTDDWVGHPLRKDYPLQGPDREPYKGRLS